MLCVKSGTAACLFESLTSGQPQKVTNCCTVMPGFSCGFPSTLTWPFLFEEVTARVKVAGEEALRNVDLFKSTYEIATRPCGATPLAALKKLLQGEAAHADQLGLPDDVGVKCFC